METKKRALGKGLEQLFNNENFDLDTFEKNVIESNERIKRLKEKFKILSSFGSQNKVF